MFCAILFIISKAKSSSQLELFNPTFGKCVHAQNDAGQKYLEFGKKRFGEVGKITEYAAIAEIVETSKNAEISKIAQIAETAKIANIVDTAEIASREFRPRLQAEIAEIAGRENRDCRHCRYCRD